MTASIKTGIIYVVSAGIYGHDASATTPASNPDVVTVSAISDSDGKCDGIGPSLKSNNATDDTFAPSVILILQSLCSTRLSLYYRHLLMVYAVDSVTSKASLSVVAAAAIIKTNSTGLTPKQIKDRMLSSSSTPVTQCEGGPQGYFSGAPMITENRYYLENSV